MINCGLEIEFKCDDCMELIDLLKQNNISIKIIGNPRNTSVSDIVLKPEVTVRGFELNFPPTTDELTLRTICNLFKDKTVFNKRCALHVHIPVENISDVDKIYNYYAEHETEIINTAKEAKLYVNLNRSINKTFDKENKFINMNCYKAFKSHHTVEHRIYKATFNFDEICWCIHQTQEIITNALKEEISSL